MCDSDDVVESLSREDAQTTGPDIDDPRDLCSKAGGMVCPEDDREEGAACDLADGGKGVCHQNSGDPLSDCVGVMTCETTSTTTTTTTLDKAGLCAAAGGHVCPGDPKEGKIN